MRWIGEIQRGLALAFGLIAFLSLILSWAIIGRIPDASESLLEAIATVGTGLFLAYVIEMAWLVTRLKGARDIKKRLGVYIGLGLTGLAGIVVALLLSAHQAAGHSNYLDDIGLAWAGVSLMVLGLVVAIHPLLVHEWSENPESN